MSPEDRKNNVMEQTKMRVDRLPSKIGSTYEFIWGGIFCTGITGVLEQLTSNEVLSPTIGIIAMGFFSLLSSLCWFCFYHYFAKAARSLKGNVSSRFDTLATLTLLTGIVQTGSLIFMIYAPMLFLISIAIIFAVNLVQFVYWIRIGVYLEKNYDGLLGYVGQGMKKVATLIGIFFILIVAYFFLTGLAVAKDNSAFIIIGTIVVFAYLLWLYIVTYYSVWDQMVDIIEDGYFILDKNENNYK